VPCGKDIAFSALVRVGHEAAQLALNAFAVAVGCTACVAVPVVRAAEANATHHDEVSMSKPPNMEAVGEHLWLLKSLGGNKHDYVVMAHSAQITGKTFYVPARSTVSFSVLKGQSLVMPNDPVNFFQAKVRRNDRLEEDIRRSGSEAPDLALGKLLGRHWLATSNEDASRDYMDLYLRMAAVTTWMPNLVLVRHRNRLIGSEIYLSYLISKILQRSTSITANFYIWGCRNVSDTAEWRLGAQAFQNAGSGL
jgi:hypothetical protein